jgi:hypothetical protein
MTVVRAFFGRNATHRAMTYRIDFCSNRLTIYLDDLLVLPLKSMEVKHVRYEYSHRSPFLERPHCF